MEFYFQAFVNFEQNDWAGLQVMAKFVNNNAKNTSIGYTLFELNCGYLFRVSVQKGIDPCSQSKTVDKLPIDLQELMIVSWKNFHHAQKLQKQAPNKSIKPKSYILGDKFG